MDKTKLGSYIRLKRLEKNLTQKELADALIIDVSAVSKWERGVSYPDITLIPALCRHLDVDEHELIESADDTDRRRLMKEARRFIFIKNTVFYSLAAAYALAVLTCFIVNIAVSHALSWFFIVLASCVCGFTFIPSVLRFFDRYHLPVYIGTIFASLFLLFLTCSVYTKDYWVWTAAAGTLLGYFALFYPILFARQKAYLTEAKYARLKRFFLITYFPALLLLTLLLLVCVNAYAPFDLTLGVKITLYCFTLPLAYGLIALLPAAKCLRIGIDAFITGAYLFGLDCVLNSLLGPKSENYYQINFADWENCSDGNVMLISVGVCVIVGAVLIVCGIRKKKNA